MTIVQAYWAGVMTGGGAMLLVLGLLWWEDPGERELSDFIPPSVLK